MEQSVKKNKKKLVGKVISDKMDKTIVVSVIRTFRDSFFQKVRRASKKYKVHDEAGKAVTGDMVEIVEGRPRSKDKYMYLSKILVQQKQ